MFEPASLNTLVGNVAAVIIAFWTRLSIETYPGIRRSSVILPAALTGHGVAVVWFLLTRFPYDRVGLAAGFLLHVAWLYVLYIRAERKLRRRIAVVPFGAIDRLVQIDGVDWHVLKRPRLAGCPLLQRDRRRFRRGLARRMGGVPRRRGARRADRLPGQAAVGVAHRDGSSSSICRRTASDRCSRRKGYLYLKGGGRFPVRAARAAVRAAGDGRAGGDCNPPRQQGPGPVPPEASRAIGPAHHRLQVPHDVSGGCLPRSAARR